MTLRLPDHWVWDAWYAIEGHEAHAFFLYAPRSLGNPHLRHMHACVGHAVSRDLRKWRLRPEALRPGPRGAFDEQATWTGSVVRHENRWLMPYTGLARRGGRWIQQLGLALSDDLDNWTKTEVVISADPRWYETAQQNGREVYWRDPWAWIAPDGTVHLLITARANYGPSDGRGVIGHAWSWDLSHWEVGPPISEPGEFRQLEVPQLLRAGSRWAVIFSARETDASAARAARSGSVAEAGVHYLIGDDPLGPFRVAPGRFLLGDQVARFYAGRILEWKSGFVLIAWRDQVDGQFVGELADPIPVLIGQDGSIGLMSGEGGPQ
jgi:beta-fructofuranosidase